MKLQNKYKNNIQNDNTKLTCSKTTWTGTVVKPKQKQLQHQEAAPALGIAFRGQGTRASPLIISDIQPNGLVARHTYLCPGLRMISINGVYVAEGWSAEELQDTLEHARPGSALTFVAQGVVAEYYYCNSSRNGGGDNDAAALGIQLYKSPILGDTAIMVGRISPFSGFADSGLQVGHRLTRINNDDFISCCPSSLKIQDIANKLVQSLQQQPAQSTTTTSTSSSSSRRLKLVAIDSYVCSSLAVQQIRERQIPNTPNNDEDDEVFYSTTCPTTTSTNISLLRDTAAGVVTTTNHDTQQYPSSPSSPSIIVFVHKPLRYGSVGLGLEKDPATNQIVIKSIAKGGVFDDTNLRVGHVLVAINGLKCPSDNITSAVKMIWDIECNIWLEVLVGWSFVVSGSSRSSSSNSSSTSGGTDDSAAVSLDDYSTVTSASSTSSSSSSLNCS